MQDVQKSYGDVVAVRSVSFAVGEREVVALLGPSGCGKTTLLRCIAGLENIDNGTIQIGGTVVSSASTHAPPERRGIGFVFQSYALWPHLTVAKNVEYGLKVARRPEAEVRRAVGDILDLVGLADHADRLPSELSGGQQQRVALARSLVVRPRVLLLDEPLSNLDASLRNRMRQEIRQLLKAVGITAIFVTHDQREAFAISDRIVLMNAGSPVQIDTAETMYARPASVFAATFVGGANVVPVTDFQDGVDGLCAARSAAFGLLHGQRSVVGNATLSSAMFRPENVQIVSSPAAGAPNCWQGVVVERVFEGAFAELVIRCDTQMVRVVGRQRDVAIGKTVTLQVAPADLLFLVQ